MASITVYLNPALNGALCELRYRSYGLDELLVTQLSVDGRVYWPQGTLTDYDVFQVRFPPQTVNGVPYHEARTSGFLFYGDVEYTLNLIEVEPTPAFKVVLTGSCGGGTPKPSMLLELYGNGVLQTSLPVPPEVLVFNQPYVLEWIVPESVSQVYGRMVLSNVLGDFEGTTEIEYLNLTTDIFYNAEASGNTTYPPCMLHGGFNIFCYVGNYTEINLRKVFRVRQFRHMKLWQNQGYGRFRVEYRNPLTGQWVTWYSNLPSLKGSFEGGMTYTGWYSPGLIYTDKIKVTATRMDGYMDKYWACPNPDAPGTMESKWQMKY